MGDNHNEKEQMHTTQPSEFRGMCFRSVATGKFKLLQASAFPPSLMPSLPALPQLSHRSPMKELWQGGIDVGGKENRERKMK